VSIKSNAIFPSWVERLDVEFKGRGIEFQLCSKWEPGVTMVSVSSEYEFKPYWDKVNRGLITVRDKAPKGSIIQEGGLESGSV